MSDVVGAALSKGEVDLKEGRVYEVAQHYKTLFSRYELSLLLHAAAKHHVAG